MAPRRPALSVQRPSRCFIVSVVLDPRCRLARGDARKMYMSDDVDLLCVNTIRCLAVDAIEAASSGHPGAPMGLAPVGYTLWQRFLKHNPANPAWPGRDRFVLSAGHASMLLYSLLYLTGYGITLDDLREFRQLGSRNSLRSS